TPHSGSETPHSGSETPHSGNLDELEPLSSNSFSNGGSQTIQTNSDPNIFSDKGGNEKSQELIQNSCTALLDKPESSGQANQIAHVEKSSVVLLDPFFNRRPKPQEIEWDWVPEGEWKVDGKLDANFVDWHARRWMQKYGALDIHEARKNVRAYHRNDPRRLADDWQEYHEATLHKATNIAVRQSNGINVPSQEKEAIAKHQAALRPSDKSVVRSQYEEVKQYIPCVEHEKFSMFSATEVHMIAAEKDIDWDALEQQTQDWEQEQIQAPEDADNPQAYTLRSASSSDKEYWARVYAARSQDVEKSVEVFASSPVKDVIAKIASSMSMPKEKMKCATNDLEQLNSWLQDPTEVLRKEAVRIAKLRGYQIELDETGNPMRISEPDF
ncbi:hypothetical protein, partial [Anabaena sp. CCY 9910]|uniref:hypothetical protein n=1 Tax=Anabaena sp. CCY 9910 TaxID=3103870 RepID=UPI0039DF7462